MQYSHLGRSGLSVSKLCLGTMNFGPLAGEDDAHAVMDAALDAGINFFDTANVYGWKKGEGVTEQIIGRWFAKGGGRREKVVIATKAYGSMSDWPNDTFLSARNIIAACEASLRRLQTDHIDLYQMHHVDRNTPWDEIWLAYEVLVQQGKVIYAGSSNFAGWHIAAAQEAARARHFLGLISEQCLYNLAVRNAEEEVLPAARANGLGVIPWSPLLGGVLGGILGKQRDTGRAASEVTQQRLQRYGNQVERYESLCRDAGLHPAVVGLAWLLHQEGVTAPIIGPRVLTQLQEVLPAAETQLDEGLLVLLGEIFPAHGSAPEAWAW